MHRCAHIPVSVHLKADRFNHVIRRLNISSGQVTTLTGTPEVSGYMDGIFARFSQPFSVDIDTAGTFTIVVRPERRGRLEKRDAI